MKGIMKELSKLLICGFLVGTLALSCAYFGQKVSMFEFTIACFVLRIYMNTEM